jgi:acyl-CoA hydrolase
MTSGDKPGSKTADKKGSGTSAEGKTIVNEGSEALAELIGKPVSASRSQMVEVVLPNDANQLGYILGGRVMHLMDIAAAIAAHRHSSGHVVTASVDYVDFRHSIKIGDLIILKSSVNRVFTTSMEVGVKVFSESTFTGEHKHTSSAYLTFVAIDAQHRPRTVPPLILETDEDRRRWAEAEGRRKIRLAQRYKRGNEKK